jgi:hypothetical protein
MTTTVTLWVPAATLVTIRSVKIPLRQSMWLTEGVVMSSTGQQQPIIFLWVGDFSFLPTIVDSWYLLYHLWDDFCSRLGLLTEITASFGPNQKRWSIAKVVHVFTPFTSSQLQVLLPVRTNSDHTSGNMHSPAGSFLILKVYDPCFNLKLKDHGATRLQSILSNIWTYH